MSSRYPEHSDSELSSLPDDNDDDDDDDLTSNGKKDSPFLPKYRNVTYSTQSLWAGIRSGRIDLEAEYQRQVVWEETEQSALIDSILNNYPINQPIFAVRTSPSGKETKICIDGKQRLTSIKRFMDGDIPLIDRRTGKPKWYPSDKTRADKKKKHRLIDPDDWNEKQISCIEYDSISEKQEREVFQRIQNGVSLTIAERLQASDSPRTTFIHTLKKRLFPPSCLTGFSEHYPDTLETSRGLDFHHLANTTFMAFSHHTKSNSPSSSSSKSLSSYDFTLPRITEFLDSPTALPPQFTKSLTEAFDIYVWLSRSDEFSPYFKYTTSPSTNTNTNTRKNKSKLGMKEFAGMGIVIYLYKDMFTVLQLAAVIRKVRREVSSKRVLLKYLGDEKAWREFVKDKDKGGGPVASVAFRSRLTGCRGGASCSIDAAGPSPHTSVSTTAITSIPTGVAGSTRSKRKLDATTDSQAITTTTASTSSSTSTTVTPSISTLEASPTKKRGRIGGTTSTPAANTSRGAKAVVAQASNTLTKGTVAPASTSSSSPAPAPAPATPTLPSVQLQSTQSSKAKSSTPKSKAVAAKSNNPTASASKPRSSIPAKRRRTIIESDNEDDVDVDDGGDDITTDANDNTNADGNAKPQQTATGCAPIETGANIVIPLPAMMISTKAELTFNSPGGMDLYPVSQKPPPPRRRNVSSPISNAPTVSTSTSRAPSKLAATLNRANSTHSATRTKTKGAPTTKKPRVDIDNESPANLGPQSPGIQGEVPVAIRRIASRSASMTSASVSGSAGPVGSSSVALKSAKQRIGTVSTSSREGTPTSASAALSPAILPARPPSVLRRSGTPSSQASNSPKPYHQLPAKPLFTASTSFSQPQRTPTPTTLSQPQRIPTPTIANMSQPGQQPARTPTPTTTQLPSVPASVVLTQAQAQAQGRVPPSSSPPGFGGLDRLRVAAAAHHAMPIPQVPLKSQLQQQQRKTVDPRTRPPAPPPLNTQSTPTSISNADPQTPNSADAGLMSALQRIQENNYFSPSSTPTSRSMRQVSVSSNEGGNDVLPNYDATSLPTPVTPSTEVPIQTQQTLPSGGSQCHQSNQPIIPTSTVTPQLNLALPGPRIDATDPSSQQHPQLQRSGSLNNNQFRQLSVMSSVPPSAQQDQSLPELQYPQQTQRRPQQPQQQPQHPQRHIQLQAHQRPQQLHHHHHHHHQHSQTHPSRPPQGDARQITMERSQVRHSQTYHPSTSTEDKLQMQSRLVHRDTQQS